MIVIAEGSGRMRSSQLLGILGLPFDLLVGKGVAQGKRYKWRLNGLLFGAAVGVGFAAFGNESVLRGLIREVFVFEEAAFFDVIRDDRGHLLVIPRIDELVDAVDAHVLAEGSKNGRKGVSRRLGRGRFLRSIRGT